MSSRRHRQRRRWAALGIGGALALVVSTVAWRPSSSQADAPVALPGVIVYNATATGAELQVIPGQYPSFKTAFIESAPYTTTSADSSPSTHAVAAPLDTAKMDNFPAALCLFFNPYYCPAFSKLPVDTYFARADSGAPEEHGSTSFPCRPGDSQPSSSVVPPQGNDPPCTMTVNGTDYTFPGLASSQAQATVTQDSLLAHAGSTAGPLTIDLPAGSVGLSTYQSRMASLRSAFSARGVPAERVAGMSAAADSGHVVDIGAVTTDTDLHLDPTTGKPVAVSHVLFTDVDVMGMVHFDSIRLEAEASTLGEAKPTVKPSVQYGAISILGQPAPFDPSSAVDRCNQAMQALYFSQNLGAPLYALGFDFYCSRVNSGGDQYAYPKGPNHPTEPTPVPMVDTNPATGYGLNPTYLDLTGPGVDFTQQTDPSAANNPSSLCAGFQAFGMNAPSSCANYQECVNPNDPGGSTLYVPGKGGPNNVPAPQPTQPLRSLPTPPPAPTLAVPSPPSPIPDVVPYVPPPPPTTGTNGSCAYLSSSSYYNNAIDVRLGHVNQQLGAAPAEQDTSCTIVCALSSGGGLPSSLTIPGIPGIPGQPGIPGSSGQQSLQTGPGGHRGKGTPGTISTQLAGAALRPWLVFGFGAWGSSVLAYLYISAALIHRRRLEGTLG